MKKLLLITSLLCGFCFSTFASVFIKAEIPYCESVVSFDGNNITNSFPLFDFAVCYELDSNTTQNFYFGLGTSIVLDELDDDTCLVLLGGLSYPLFTTRNYAWKVQGEINLLTNLDDYTSIFRPTVYIYMGQPEEKGFFLMSGLSYLIQFDTEKPFSILGEPRARGFGFKAGIGYHF